MILRALPATRRSEIDIFAIAHMIFMMFDGFAISAHINPRAACTREMVNQFADFLLGEAGHQKAKRLPKSGENADRRRRIGAVAAAVDDTQ